MGNRHGVEFAILGHLVLSVGGRAVNVGGTTPRALLAMLLLQINRPVRTETLMSGLWGEDLPRSATGSLHSHISRLRRLLPTSDDGFRIERRPGGYALCGDPERLDAQRFERLVLQGRDAGDSVEGQLLLRGALALWRGPALADFPDAEFARAEAVRLDELRLETTGRVVDLELALGHASRLVPDLEQLVLQHPLQERFWGQLMVALYRDGRQADALNAFRRARTVLDVELGVEPGPALRRLEHLVLHQSPELDGAVDHEPAMVVRKRPSPAEDSGFVGRAEATTVLDEAFERAAEGVGQLVVVEAAAGMGKTAVVEHFARRSAAQGVEACLGRAWEESGGPPFWPWIEVLRSRSRQRGEQLDPAAVALADLVAGEEKTWPRDPVAARARLYEETVSRLFPGDGAAASLVVLEDFHAADESSLGLLRFLLRRLRSARCMVVLTHRPVEQTSALTGLLADAARDVAITRIPLARLSDAEVRRHLEQRLGSSASADVVAATIERAEGHPFFLVEIVRLLSSRLGLESPETDAERAAEIPRTVSEMIGRRFAALPDETLRVLSAASVIGRDFDLRTLANITSLNFDAVLDHVEGAAATGLVQELPAGVMGYRFDHALTQQTLYARLPGPRRAMLHARAAAALEYDPSVSAEDRLGELARHRCHSVAECGVPTAVDAAVAAGAAAADRLAFEEAARLYELGLDTHEKHSGDPTRVGPLLLALSVAHARAGQPERARAGFLRAAQLARAQRDGEQLAAAALGFASAFEVHGYDDDLVRLLKEALASTPLTRKPERARILARLSMALNLRDPAGRRHELSRLALLTAREVGDPALEGFCLSAHFFAIVGTDLHEERTQCAKDALALAYRLGDPEAKLDALTWAVCDVLERADRPELDGCLKRHAELAAASHHPLHRYYACMWQASILGLEGRAREAVVVADRAAELGAALTDLAAARRAALLAVVHRDLGRWLELVPLVDKIVAAAPLLPTWRAVRATMAYEAGDHAGAERFVAELPEDVGSFLPRDGNWVAGMCMFAELASTMGRAELSGRLFDSLATHCEHMGTVRLAVACTGPVDRMLGRLAATCGDFGTAQRHFEAALTVCGALGARPFHARSQADYARMLLRRAQRGDAAHAARLFCDAQDTAKELDLPGLRADCTPDAL